jgi:hypothetical protein
VTEQFHHDARMDAGAEEQGCGGVPAVVEADVTDASGFENGLPCLPVALAVDRAAVGLVEDELMVLPEVGRPLPLPVSLDSVAP